MAEQPTGLTPDAPGVPPAQADGNKHPSSSVNDVMLKLGQHVFQRLPSQWILAHTPDKMADMIRRGVAKGFRHIGDKYLMDETTLQEQMNGKLFINVRHPESGSPMLEEVEEGYIKRLFPQGKRDQWPQQLVICTKDIRPEPYLLHQRMENMAEFIDNIVGTRQHTVESQQEDTAGKLVVLGAYHTDNSILHNGAAILERIQTLRADSLSLKGMSPAAMQVGDMLLDAITLRKEGSKTILRSDAQEVMRHVMLHGFSQGANVASDAFRYMRRSILTNNFAIATDPEGEETQPFLTDKQIGKLFSGSYIFNVASPDVPYDKGELIALPPRDNVRSNGDLVVSSAVGVPHKQENYHNLWRQNEVDQNRKDRFLESIGPVKRLLGREPRSAQYHAYLGHGEEIYWQTEVEQARLPLQERFASRFADKTVASDITFHHDLVAIDLERGISPEKAMFSRGMFLGLISQDGTIHEQKAADGQPSPYRIMLNVSQEMATISKINDALSKADIIPSREVGYLLGMKDGIQDDAGEKWLQKRLERPMPGAQVSSHYGPQGPFFRISREEGFTDEEHQRLKSGLRKYLNVPGKHDLSEDRTYVDVPFDCLVASIKLSEMKTRQQQARAHGR